MTLDHKVSVKIRRGQPFVIFDLFSKGLGSHRIAHKTGIPRSTVVYYLRKFRREGKRPDQLIFRHIIDWSKVRKARLSGKTVRWCMKKFKFALPSYSRALKRGDVPQKIVVRPVNTLEMLIKRRRKSDRSMVRKIILRDNILPYVCAVCGAPPFWRSAPLSLILDHKNGLNWDHRIENIRFACPNCASQFPTNGSKNWSILRHYHKSSEPACQAG